MKRLAALYVIDISFVASPYKAKVGGSSPSAPTIFYGGG